MAGGAQDSRAPLPSQLLPRCRYFALPSRSVRAKLFFFLFWGVARVLVPSVTCWG